MVSRETIEQLDAFSFNPINDVAFKYIFGSEDRKQITLAFLNAVLEPSFNRSITELKFVPVKMYPVCDCYEPTRLDAVCTLDDKESINVEIQVVNTEDIHQRTIFYWTQLYQKSFQPDGTCQDLLSYVRPYGTYRDLIPAVVVKILGFRLPPKTDGVSFDTYSICSLKTGRRLNKDMELHFLDIPQYREERRLNRVPVAEMTSMERWLAYLSDSVGIQEKEELAMADAAISRAMEESVIFLPNTLKLQYLEEQRSSRDDKYSMEAGYKEGIEEGIEESKKEIAVQMLKDNLPIETIQRYTSLSRPQIEQIAKENSLL